MKKLAMILLVPLCVACGQSTEKENNVVVIENNDSPNNGANNSTAVGSDECVNRCAAKAISCEFPGDAEMVCAAQFCAGQLTVAELECLEQASCAELASADTTFCSGGTQNQNPNNTTPNNTTPNNSTPNNSTPNNSNPNNAPANNDEGESCNCDPHPEYMGQDTVYAYCEGTENGCKYDIFGDGPKLGCLYNYETGAGTCAYTCSEDDDGAQGSCPDGDICGNSGLRSLTGTFWYQCN